MKLTWTKCPCGHSFCDYYWPKELGHFYQGTGFRLHERELMDRAFAALDVVWLRDVDGTGSMQPCAKGDPGAVRYIRG